MAQIGFTAKTEPVYDRFNKMRLAYAEEHGRTYAPDFLTVLMDVFEKMGAAGQSASMSLLDLLNATKDLDGLTPDEIAALDEAIAEANEQVVIKDGYCRYMTQSIMAGANFFLTDYKEKAMVFDNRDQATTFLRKCGHEVGNWIIEPA